MGPSQKTTSGRPVRRTGKRVQRDTTRIRKSTTRRTTASTRTTTTTTPPTTLQGLVKKDARRQEVGSGSPKPTSGHQELPHEASSKDIAPSEITTIGTPKREILNRPLDTEISSATLEHQEKEESRDRRRHATTQTRSALRTKTMQNQWFLKGPIHISNSKVASKDQRCPEVGLGIPKPTSGHQELESLATRSEVSRSQIRNS